MSSRQPISSLPPSSIGCFFSLICCSGSLQLQQEGEGRWKERREVETGRGRERRRGQRTQGTSERERKRRAGVSSFCVAIKQRGENWTCTLFPL